MDESAKKIVLRWFTYGLHAVTAAHGGEVAMMTANFITQSAFTPPHVALANVARKRLNVAPQACRAFVHAHPPIRRCATDPGLSRFARMERMRIAVPVSAGGASALRTG